MVPLSAPLEGVVAYAVRISEQVRAGHNSLPRGGYGVRLRECLGACDGAASAHTRPVATRMAVSMEMQPVRALRWRAVVGAGAVGGDVSMTAACSGTTRQLSKGARAATRSIAARATTITSPIAVVGQ